MVVSISQFRNFENSLNKLKAETASLSEEIKKYEKIIEEKTLELKGYTKDKHAKKNYDEIMKKTKKTIRETKKELDMQKKKYSKVKKELDRYQKGANQINAILDKHF